MRFRLLPTLIAAACLMLALAACSNRVEPAPEMPQVAKTDTEETREVRTLEPSLSPWEGPHAAEPGDEILLVEEMGRLAERRYESNQGLGGGRASGGYAHRRTRGSRAGEPPPPPAPPPADRDGQLRKRGDSPAQVGVDPTVQASEGSLFAKKGKDFVGQFPLEHTDVKAEISGYLGQTTVTQSFTNPFTEVIEAVYTFPLPGDAAINDFLMVIGERRIRGLIRPRAEAERIYAEARSRGYTASLLTQERPNVFTQNVANIEVGGAVDIEITYFQTLNYENGRYEYYFPMVVAPRYTPGKPLKDAGEAENSGDAPVGGQGTSPDTDRVPDASKVTPPVLPDKMRSGHDISITLDIDAGMPINMDVLESIAHKVQIESVSDQRIAVALTDEDNILNRDFVFRWGMDNSKPVGGVLAHRGDRGGFFTLMLQPQLDPADKDVTPREVTFILDVSGSMNGVPIAASKDVISRSLDTLRPEDIFNIVYFASGNGQVFEKPMPNTPENIAKAKEFIKQARASGGTEMLAGLQRALDAEHNPAYLQMYVFLTDGMISGEAEIHRLCKEYSDRARFFAFGIHSSPNRHLIDGIGENGRGKVHYCYTSRDEKLGERAARAFYSMIDSPVLCDIHIDWNGLPVTDVYGDVNDLFAGQPIQLAGRYDGPAEGTIFINGRVGANYITIPVEVSLPEAEPRNESLGAIWARKRIADIEKQLLSKPEDKQLNQQGEDLALEFNLMSRWTSFVAVDESRIVGDGSPLKVMQPVELPEGVDREGVMANMTGKPMRVGAWGMTLVQNQQGGIAVVHLDDNSPAGQAGVATGHLLASIDGVAINDMNHLQGLLMQTSGKVQAGFNVPEGDVHTIRSVELPRP